MRQRALRWSGLSDLPDRSRHKRIFTSGPNAKAATEAQQMGTGLQPQTELGPATEGLILGHVSNTLNGGYQPRAW
jgi:hypothetical protein